MAFYRILVLLTLLACIGCFGMYAFTSKPRYKLWGIKLLRVAVVVALGFFGVLFIERL